MRNKQKYYCCWTKWSLKKIFSLKKKEIVEA